MSLPTSLLTAVENHPCFSGVWSHDCNADCVTDPGAPPRPTFVVRCDDCLLHHFAVDARLLDPGMNGRNLAQRLTEHVRRHRGYSLSAAGYHGAGPSLWLSAAYWPRLRAFVVSSGTHPALDALVMGIQRRVIVPPHPNMDQVSNYRAHDVYLTVVPPPRPTSLAALLASPHVSSRPRAGYQRVTIAEFLAPPPSPGSAASTAAGASGSTPGAHPPTAARAARKAGDRCPNCGETITEAPLLYSTSLTCGCT